MTPVIKATAPSAMPVIERAFDCLLMRAKTPTAMAAIARRSPSHGTRPVRKATMPSISAVSANPFGLAGAAGGAVMV